MDKKKAVVISGPKWYTGLNYDIYIACVKALSGSPHSSATDFVSKFKEVFAGYEIMLPPELLNSNHKNELVYTRYVFDKRRNQDVIYGKRFMDNVYGGCCLLISSFELTNKDDASLLKQIEKFRTKGCSCIQINDVPIYYGPYIRYITHAGDMVDSSAIMAPLAMLQPNAT